jgi:general secretion pathway protein K
MKVTIQSSPKGIALIIVMIVVVVLGILAGGFAYSMKVETALARNASMDTELEWLGRSGIELARYVLAQQLNVPGENGYTALNQKWAGGSSVTNELLADISLDNYQLGRGSFSVKIIDLERKYNINVPIVTRDATILRQAMTLMGMDAVETPQIANAILDWGDLDDDTQFGSSETESSFYLSLNPPYYAKNGPIDDLSELLLIHGITPQMYWGPGATTNQAYARMPAAGPTDFPGGQPSVGLVDLFTTISSGFVNLNTAPATVLQLFPEIDENMANAIVNRRAGLDGVEGTEDDLPFRSPGELATVPSAIPGIAGQIASRFVVQSVTFEVHVTAQIDQVKREYVAIVRRENPRVVPVLYVYWK